MSLLLLFPQEELVVSRNDWMDTFVHNQII